MVSDDLLIVSAILFPPCLTIVAALLCDIPSVE